MKGRGIDDIPVTLQIGKSGITDNVLREMDSQLFKAGVLKVRALRSAPEIGRSKEAFQDVSARLEARLVSFRGHTAVLERKPGRRVLGPEKE